MSASQATQLLMRRLHDNAIPASWDDANTLRRAQITLSRWSEQVCGGGNDYFSWSIERDEHGLPYRCVYHRNGEMRRSLIADKEAAALRRVARICKALGCHFHHQTNPRWCALYVCKEPMSASDYSRGVACL